jgi:predicted transposase YdaD
VTTRTTRTTRPKKTTKKKDVNQTPKPIQRGTDETFYQLMQLSGSGILKLLGFSQAQADQYRFQATVLKDKRLEPDIEGIPILDTNQGRVIIEFQGYPDPYIRYRLATQVFWSCLQDHYDQPVTAAIIYTDKAYQAAALPLQAFAKRRQCLLTKCIQEIILTNYTEEQLIAIDPRLIVLAAFTVSRQLDKAALAVKAKRWRTQITQAFPEPHQRQEALNVLSLFMFSRFHHLTREEVLKMFRLDLMETVAGQEIYELGVQEGVVRNARETVVKILSERFGAVPAKMLKQLQVIDSGERLEALQMQALRCRNLTQFKEVLAPK